MGTQKRHLPTQRPTPFAAALASRSQRSPERHMPAAPFGPPHTPSSVREQTTQQPHGSATTSDGSQSSFGHVEMSHVAGQPAESAASAAWTVKRSDRIRSSSARRRHPTVIARRRSSSSSSRGAAAAEGEEDVSTTAGPTAQRDIGHRPDGELIRSALAAAAAAVAAAATGPVGQSPRRIGRPEQLKTTARLCRTTTVAPSANNRLLLTLADSLRVGDGGRAPRRRGGAREEWW
uniref:Uncharacterized protein n=1 Tax=Plectus sambesii TaxID=2011161 RepID=A0A914WKS7_9BILA